MRELDERQKHGDTQEERGDEEQVGVHIGFHSVCCSVSANTRVLYPAIIRGQADKHRTLSSKTPCVFQF